MCFSKKENVCWSATFAKYKFSYEFFPFIPFIVEMEYFNFLKYISILSKLFI